MGNENKGFPTPEDVKKAIDLLASGRLRLRLFLKSLETIFGISDIQLDFIDLIGRKKAISPTDLAIELDVNKATISGHIENLIENNLIQESPSLEDGRKKQLHLTDMGSKLYQFTNLIQSRVIQRLLTFIGPDIFAQVNSHLNTIVKTIDAKKQAIKDLIQTNPEMNMQTLMEFPLEDLFQKFSKIFPFLLGDIDTKSIPLEEILWIWQIISNLRTQI